jgi:hypothetical protein
MGIATDRLDCPIAPKVGIVGSRHDCWYAYAVSVCYADGTGSEMSPATWIYDGPRILSIRDYIVIEVAPHPEAAIYLIHRVAVSPHSSIATLSGDHRTGVIASFPAGPTTLWNDTGIYAD